MHLLGRRALLKGLLAATLPVRLARAAQDPRRPVWREPAFSDSGEWITPVGRFYVRHHLGVPQVDTRAWKLVIEGLVRRRLEITYADLLRLSRTRAVVTSECAGNLPGGGMVGNAEWSGVRLATLLKEAGIQREAVEVILDGADCGLDEGENIPVCYSRSIPVGKALAPETLLAWEMNGKPLLPEHGYPLRAVIPGWYAMANVKWVRRIEVTDRPFAGFFMSKRYFTAKRDAVTGEFLLTPVREMGIKSQIARPRNGEVLKPQAYRIQGAAWTGPGRVARVEVSVDGGKAWQPATLGKQQADYAWTFWEYRWESPETGKHMILVRASDDCGESQPAAEDSERINRYDNRWVHRVRVEVSA